MKLSGVRLALRADLDDFICEPAKKYFSTVRTQDRQCTLYLGPTIVGSWGVPPPVHVVKAAGEYLDVLRTT